MALSATNNDDRLRALGSAKFCLKERFNPNGRLAATILVSARAKRQPDLDLGMADKAIFLRLVPSVSLQSTYLPYERDRKIENNTTLRGAILKVKLLDRII